MKTEIELTSKVQKEVYGKLLGMYIFYVVVGVVCIVACSTLFAFYGKARLLIAVMCVAALCVVFGAFFIVYFLKTIKNSDKEKVVMKYDFGEDDFTVTTFKADEKTSEKTFSYRKAFYKETKNYIVMYGEKSDPLPMDKKISESECAFFKEKVAGNHGKKE